jgi:hypothetical protein
VRHASATPATKPVLTTLSASASTRPRQSVFAELELAADDELDVDELAELELDSLLLLDSAFEPAPASFPDSFDDPLLSEDDVEPLADFVDDRESVMYQPLPLKTMPTG